MRIDLGRRLMTTGGDEVNDVAPRAIWGRK
jgi:hypothetical protein